MEAEAAAMCETWFTNLGFHIATSVDCNPVNHDRVFTEIETQKITTSRQPNNDAIVRNCISDYNIRDFIVERNAFNAFQGISELFKLWPRPVHGLYRVSIFTEQNTATEGLALGLGWTTTYGITVGRQELKG